MPMAAVASVRATARAMADSLGWDVLVRTWMHPVFGLTSVQIFHSFVQCNDSRVTNRKSRLQVSQTCRIGAFEAPAGGAWEVVGAYRALTGGALAAFLQNAHLSMASNGILINSRLAPICDMSPY